MTQPGPVVRRLPLDFSPYGQLVCLGAGTAFQDLLQRPAQLLRWSECSAVSAWGDYGLPHGRDGFPEPSWG